MFERFTQRARRAVILAQEEARRLDHDYIGSEHLLLGLISEAEGIAAQALRASDLTREAVLDEVVRHVGPARGAPRSHIPFTPDAKRTLELGLRSALDLGHNYIGT